MSQPDELMDRETSRKVSILGSVLPFLKPYKMQIAGAFIALVVTSMVTLMFGQGLRLLIDQGFSQDSTELLGKAILLFVGLTFVLAIGTFARFYLVTSVGERAAADIRNQVFAHVVRLHPGFFDQNLASEIQSRITTDTTLVQTVIGSSASLALRNFFILVGGIILMLVSSLKLRSWCSSQRPLPSPRSCSLAGAYEGFRAIAKRVSRALARRSANRSVISRWCRRAGARVLTASALRPRSRLRSMSLSNACACAPF